MGCQTSCTSVDFSADGVEIVMGLEGAGSLHSSAF